MLEYFYGRKCSILCLEWSSNLVVNKTKKNKRYLEANRKSKLEIRNKILAVRETKILSKTPEKVLDFQPLDVVA